MKKILVLLILLNAVWQLYAQNAMPADSAMWVYGVRLYEDTPAHVRNLTVKLRGDTLLGGVKYGKIFYAWGHDTTYNSPNNYLHCFIRNDNNHRVFVRYPLTTENIDTSDVLLYDFSQALGDTFNLPVRRVGFDAFMCDSSYKYAVGSANTAWSNFYNGDIRILQYETANSLCIAQFSQMREFYGSDDFIFHNELNVFPLCAYDMNDGDSIYSSQSRCFWYKGKWFVQPCELHGVGIGQSDIIKSEINIKPNPFQESAELSFTANKFETFQLLDLLGKTVFDASIQDNQHTIFLQRVNLKSGIYFGRFTGEGNISGTIKIIIN